MVDQGYIFCIIQWRGGGDRAREKMKNEAVSYKMRKKEKGGKLKEEKEKVFFLLI